MTHAFVAAQANGDNRTMPESQSALQPIKKPVIAEDFKTAFRNHPAGVAVITADAGDGPVGLTATSVASVSTNPPLLVFSLSAHSSSGPAVNAAETVVVHLLGDKHLGLAKTFATSGIDRFADASIWSRLATGEPFLPSVSTWMRGKIVNRMEAGDSTIIAVEILEVRVPDEETQTAEHPRPLIYHNRTWHVLSDSSTIE